MIFLARNCTRHNEPAAEPCLSLILLHTAAFEMAPEPTKAELAAKFLPVKYHYPLHVGKVYNLITHKDGANASNTMEPNLLDPRGRVEC